MILDPNQNSEHLGDIVKIHSHYDRMADLEKAFREKCEAAGIEWSYDCTAEENPYFKTLNYTTYAGMFIMHPLSFSLTYTSMFEALQNGRDNRRYSDAWFKRFIRGVKGKYERRKPQSIYKSDGVIVMTGSNKWDHMCMRRVRKLSNDPDSVVLVKPHPLTHDHLIEKLESFIPNNRLLKADDDLYDALEYTKTVYTTHLSETAFTASCLGKKIWPCDRLEYRSRAAFSHINYWMFVSDNPLATANKLFDSPYSGVIDLDVDQDWESKMDQYFDHILSYREREKGHYEYGT